MSQPITQGQVRLGSEYFRKVFAEYSNWRMAYAREMVQNMYDACIEQLKNVGDSYVGRIRFDFDFAARTITASDNGTGMTLEVLTEVLLNMGGTTKLNDNTAGGFGYAKNVLYFAQDNYRIETLGYDLRGQGAEFQIFDREGVTPDMTALNLGHRVTVSTVTFPNAAAMEEIRTVYRNLVRIMDPIIPFEFFDGDEQLVCGDISSWMWEQTETDLGTLWFVQDKGDELPFMFKNQVWLRRKGQPLFAVSVPSNEIQLAGVLDLDPNLPLKEVLTANRDGLTYSYNSKLYRLASRLAYEQVTADVGPRASFVLNPYSLPTDISQEHGRTASGGVSNEYDFVTDNASHPGWNKLDKIDARMYPHNMSISSPIGINTKQGTELIRYLTTQKAAKLAHQWNIVVKYILTLDTFKRFVEVRTENGGREWDSIDEYTEFYFDGTPIVTGFIFQDCIEGMHTVTGGIHNILMNPTTLPEDYDFEWLIDLAIHETAHLLLSEHTARFSAITDLIRFQMRKSYGAVEIRKWAEHAARTKVKNG